MPLLGDRFEFTKANVDTSPEKLGVYGLYDASDFPIYYGSSEVSIRSRLQRHKAGLEGPCTQSATYYRREPCPNPVERERALLQEHARQYGKLPRYNSVVP
jgi:hypothetical protein